MNQDRPKFYQAMKHPVKFRFFLFFKLPAAWFAGVRIREIDGTRCRVTIPYKWLTRNPFRSTYFASLSMAAEMSTGALAMSYLYKLDPPVSMLVINVDSTYFKKAVGRTSFLCEDGENFSFAIQEAIDTGEARTVRAKSVGTNKEGDIVAEFYITWSFKTKIK